MSVSGARVGARLAVLGCVLTSATAFAPPGGRRVLAFGAAASGEASGGEAPWSLGVPTAEVAAMEEAREVYLSCVGQALGVVSASVREDEVGWVVRVERKVADVDENAMVRYVERFLVLRSTQRVVSLGRGEAVPAKRVVFASGDEYRLVFEASEDEAEPRVEAWRGGTRLWARRAPHGGVASDETPALGGSSWCGSRVAYVADEHRAKKKKRNLGEYDFVEDFGEKLPFSRPCVYQCDLETGVIDRVVEDAGQPALSRHGRLAVVRLGPRSRFDGRKLGLTYCFNRASSVEVDGERVECDEPLARSPRWDDDGTLAYLKGDFETHDGPVDVVAGAATAKGFYGVAVLPEDCWRYKKKAVVFDALDGADPGIVLVDETGVRSLVKKATLLAAAPGVLLAHRRQAPDDPGVVSLATEDAVIDLPLGPTARPTVPLPALRTDAVGPRAFVVSAPNAERLVLVPHGGPHSCSRATYAAPVAFLASRGYACLLVNYRGSIGFGDETELLGRVAEIDVDDCVAATTAALEALPHLDRRRVAVCGGSHGGFLTAHLIARHPDLFKVASMRNPVVNLLSMLATTDIPDWVAVEAGLQTTKTSHALTDADLLTLRDRSPLATVAAVTAPSLIAIGLKDKRVPPSQGLEFYHALTAPKRLLAYPDDDHAIDSPKSAADYWLATLDWFDTHLAAINDHDAPPQLRNPNN